MSRLWTCPDCDRQVNPFVNDIRCPSCGHKRECPECGEELSNHPCGVPGMFWCDGCEKEFWQEGTESPSWFACGTDGVIHGV